MDDTTGPAVERGVEPPAVRAPRGRVVLAHEAPLSLGPLSIEPALRRVVHAGGGEEILQPRVMQVLVALARARGEILTRDELQESCWHGVVVGEDALNRVIGQLRRVCDQLAGEALRLETITKVGYRLLAAEVAEPAPAMDRPTPVARPDPSPLLAVLAFDNLSGDPDFLYFSDGISEEILLTVAKTTKLRVVGRASSFQFRREEKSARRVAEQLGATHVLDGAVRRSGDRLRISVELVDCITQTSLWSDRFDRNLSDVFALQDEIAAQVAEALNAQFAPSPMAGPIDPAAYDLYLRARDLSLDRVNFDIGLLEQAVAIAPGFAQAGALLAFARAILFRWVQAGDASTAVRLGAIQAAERAVALDPSAAYAYLALEIAEPICSRFAERLALVDKALAAAPNDPIVLIHAGGLCDVLGYQRLAYDYVERAYQLDPRYAAFYYPYVLEGAGRIEEAREVVERDATRWPDAFLLQAAALRFAYEAGDWDRYDRRLARLRPQGLGMPLIPNMREMAEAIRSWTGEQCAAQIAKLRRQLETSGAIPVSSLGFLAKQGFADQVFDLLDEASFDHLYDPLGRLTPGEVSLNILFTPMFAVLRRDPRFVRLCAKLGLVDHWIAADHWPDFELEVAYYYDLRAEARRLSNA
ncbi:MAG: hypothetical protein E7812_14555 [Phenylobacterium sp.]|nr:MAG: hypothetical protein E7812_14555 [Phenylobacterium sp.]